MKLSARQLTLDLYNCSAETFSDIDEIKDVLKSVVGSEPRLTAESMDENHFAIIGAFEGGHIALHGYSELRYVAVDIFTCAEDESEPEKLSKTLRQFFRPDKLKSTFLKRGDFGKGDIKPKIKTKVAPLRKVKNAGAKVVNKLVRGNDK